MVSTCSGCNAPFLYWGTGRLFQFERATREPELFWVCNACLERIHLVQDSDRNVHTIPNQRAA